MFEDKKLLMLYAFWALVFIAIAVFASRNEEAQNARTSTSRTPVSRVSGTPTLSPFEQKVRARWEKFYFPNGRPSQEELSRNGPPSSYLYADEVLELMMAGDCEPDDDQCYDAFAEIGWNRGSSENPGWSEEQVLDIRDGETLFALSNCAGGCRVFPYWCAPPIKGNISIGEREKIYHESGQEYYDETEIITPSGERWFCTVEEAEDAGWRAAEW